MLRMILIYLGVAKASLSFRFLSLSARLRAALSSYDKFASSEGFSKSKQFDK